MVATHDEHQVGCSVTAAALTVLETYSNIVTDIYGDPDERPMVLTQEHRTRFCAVVTAFYDAIKTHGVPFAHDDLRLYGDTAAHGAAHALSKKLAGAILILNLCFGEDPESLTSYLDGVVVVTGWQELLIHQARARRSTCSLGPGSPELRPEEQVIGWPSIIALLGFSSKDRRGKEMVMRLNRESRGPITLMRKRTVVVGRESLMAWWKLHREQNQDCATKRRIADRDSAVRDETLSNAGVRKDEGFHLKKSRGR